MRALYYGVSKSSLVFIYISIKKEKIIQKNSDSRGTRWGWYRHG